MRPYLRPFLSSLVVTTVLLGIAVPQASAECTPYWKSSQTLDLPDLGGIVAVDFNNDGVPDLGMTTYSRTLVALTNPVTRELGSPVDLLLRSGTGDPLAGDFTADGVVDLVVRSSVAKTFSTFPGNGDGTFDEEVLTVASMQPGLFVSGDFNADSKLDLAVLSFDGTSLSLWAGNGAGGFSSTAQVTLPAAGRGLAAMEFTGDEDADVLVATSGGLLLVAGNGDGTLQTAESVAVGNFKKLAAVDMDGDGDVDAITTADDTATLSVHLNDGTGAFPEAFNYSTRHQPGHTGSASSISVGNVTADSFSDVVLTLEDDWLIATFVANGDGSLAPPDFRSAIGPESSALADIDGDGRIDLIYRASDADLALNNCGDVTVTAQAVTPIVSVGHHLRVTASMTNGINDAPSGEISIVEGEVALATAHVSTSPSADIELPLLPAGTHTFKAVFEGNASFHPAESSAFSAVVTEETTTTTVAVTTPAEEIVFGNSVHLEASVTSTLPGTPEGLMRFSIDGVQQPAGNCCSYSWYRPHAGEHTVLAEYLGSATHPPSTSDAITVTVAKAASTVQLLVNVSSTVGEQITVSITPDRAGEIKLYDGTIELFSGTANGYDPVAFIIPGLAPGTHRLVARYVGTTDYLPSEQTAEHTVLAPGSISIDAHADGNAIHLLWRSSQPALRYFEVRFLSGGSWQTAATGEVQAGQPASGVFWFNDVTANETRVFQMLGWDSSWTPLSPSNIDAASVATFVDETLTPGATTVKSQHFTDVLAGINRLRAASAGSPIAIPGLGAGNFIRYVDLMTLRQKANDARFAVGMVEYPFTDRGTSRTILIRDIEELRNAVR